MAEDDSGPSGGPVGFSGSEIGPDPSPGFGIEYVFVDKVVESRLAEVSERSAHPLCHGQGETHFGAIPNLSWQEVVGGSKEQTFGDAMIEFFLCWIGEDGFNQRVIEEGHSDFDRVGHAHGIGVAEERISHIVSDFSPRDFGHGIEQGR